jgi:hypothetical protein
VDKLQQAGKKKMEISAALVAVIAMACTLSGNGQSPSYDGHSNGIGNLYRLSNATTFSIGPEILAAKKEKAPWRPWVGYQCAAGVGTGLETKPIHCGWFAPDVCPRRVLARRLVESSIRYWFFLSRTNSCLRAE